MERRQCRRYELQEIPEPYRQCDISLSRGDDGVDAVLENLSSSGLCLRFPNGSAPSLNPGRELFICGCILNHLIGIMSSSRGRLVWNRGECCGVHLDKPLGVPEDTICEAVSCTADFLDD